MVYLISKLNDRIVDFSKSSTNILKINNCICDNVQYTIYKRCLCIGLHTTQLLRQIYFNYEMIRFDHGFYCKRELSISTCVWVRPLTLINLYLQDWKQYIYIITGKTLPA